jgi:hypothetical protein
MVKKQLSQEEAFAKAIRRYPLGTKIKPLYGSTQSAIIVEHNPHLYNGGVCLRVDKTDTSDSCLHVYNFNEDRWADIMSYPANYSPEQNFFLW